MSTDFICLQRNGRREREKFLAILEWPLFLSTAGGIQRTFGNYTGADIGFMNEENENETKP
jgi:hypothetical protein